MIISKDLFIFGEHIFGTFIPEVGNSATSSSSSSSSSASSSSPSSPSSPASQASSTACTPAAASSPATGNGKRVGSQLKNANNCNCYHRCLHRDNLTLNNAASAAVTRMENVDKQDLASTKSLPSIKGQIQIKREISSNAKVTAVKKKGQKQNGSTNLNFVSTSNDLFPAGDESAGNAEDNKTLMLNAENLNGHKKSPKPHYPTKHASLISLENNTKEKKLKSPNIRKDLIPHSVKYHSLELSTITDAGAVAVGCCDSSSNNICKVKMDSNSRLVNERACYLDAR
uniref:Uncharacterized protein n=1 Tax=Glossina austeni TaxID=7395 RepID=A0A1A9UX87_GLOAU